MEFLNQYVVLIIVGICYCLGYIIKHSITVVPNKFIPLIMGVIGILLNMWMNKWMFSPEILLGGLASGLASTGAFELLRNIKNNSDCSDKKVIRKSTSKRTPRKKE
ncbi:phage holin family protein [Clostridium sp. KNHs205]|uniref:phage holin family protein n=1 Tax=Clostridium sp. KNHs205 TaxID=1449050 RepID=UPI0009DFABE0|nr:phage holin family protein [Clostridium sp. KNHs205]